MTPPSGSPQTPPAGRLRRWARRLFSLWMLKRLAFATAGLATLLALVLAAENWRGRRALDRYLHEWEAKGEQFDHASVIPPSVPDDQNFAMTPLLADLFRYERVNGAVQWEVTNALSKPIMSRVRDDYLRGGPTNALAGGYLRGRREDLRAWQEYYRAARPQPQGGSPRPATQTNSLTPVFPLATPPQTPARDVLLALSRYKNEFDELHAAAKRPFTRFPIHYESTIIDVLLPHLAKIKNICTVLSLRATAALADGQTDAAFEDLKIGFRCSDGVAGEPYLISYLVRVAAHTLLLQPLWEGLADHRWTDEQLEYWGDYLRSIDFFAGYRAAIRGERAIFQIAPLARRRGPGDPPEQSADPDPLTQIQRTMRRMPKGWIYQNQLNLYRGYQAAIDCRPGDHGGPHESFVATQLSKRTPYNILAAILAPAFAKSFEKAERAQTYLNLARIACALERHRLAHRSYPATLDALKPVFLADIPEDFMGKAPLQYRVLDDGRFLLYSVGPDGKDDQGAFEPDRSKVKGPAPSFDWVWRYPPPAPGA